MTRFVAQPPSTLPVPLIVALHIPAGYTDALARRLAHESRIRVVEAADGEIVPPGTVAILPGGQQSTLDRTLKGVRFRHAPPRRPSLYSPSADELFESAAEGWGSRCLGVVLTGMGDDGLIGSAALVQAGGRVVTESPSSSIISGMPRVPVAYLSSGNCLSVWSEPVKRVLVTGALGNVGREVMRECLAAGMAVRAAVLDETRARRDFPQAEAVRFDFLDRSTWPAALTGCNYLFLLRPPPLGDMTKTLNPFIDAAYESGVEHVVFLSVMGADRMKWVPHRKVELHLRDRGEAWTVLRPGFFSQNLQDAYKRDIIEDHRLYVPAAEGRVAFLDVRDAAALCAQVLQQPETFRQKIFTLTGPVAIGFDEVAATLSDILGVEIRYERASIAGYIRHLRQRRGQAWMHILVQTFLHYGLRNGDAETVDPTVKQMLGRDGRSLREYVKDCRSVWSATVTSPHLSVNPL